MKLSMLFLVKIKGGNMSRKQRVKPSIERQRGRSMVEMLGVLTLVGVLSIGGVVGYQYAMQIFRENQTLNAFSATTAGARTADLMDTYFYSCANFPCVVEPKYVISGVGDLRDGDFSTAVGAPVRVQIENENGYTVRIRGVSRVICETLKQGRWEESCAGIDPTGDTAAPDGCSAEFLGDLANVDCNSLPQADGGLARRSALQEEIDTEGIGWVNFDEAGHPAFVLYYNDKHTLSPRPDEPYNPDDSDEEDEDNSLYCIEGEPRDSEGHITKTCCNEAGGMWRNNLCCVNSGANEGSLFTSPSTLKDPNCWCMPNGSGGISPKSIKSKNKADSFCCHAAGLTWKNGECCNGDKTWDFKTSPNCGSVPEEFCPTPHVIKGTVCCEVDNGHMTGRDYRSGLINQACMIAEPKPTCSSFGCSNGFTATEKGDVCCCGEINAYTNLRDTKCYSDGPTCSDKEGECFDAECTVCCRTAADGKTTDNVVNRWCCEADNGTCSDDSCTVCCEKDADGNTTGKDIGGGDNSACQSAPMTCQGLGGECSDELCTVCCNPKNPGRDMNGDEQEVCKKTCADQGGIESGSVCCANDGNGNMTGYDINGNKNTSACSPAPICDQGIVVGTVCCQKDTNGNKTGYEIDGDTKNSVCEPTCDEQGGLCSDSSCSVCCQKDTNGNKNGNDIEGNPEQMCEPTCDEQGGLCSDSSCSVCCEKEKTGRDINNNPNEACCRYWEGEMIETVCCEKDKTGKEIDGKTENNVCLTCEDQGGISIDGYCCNPYNRGYTMGNEPQSACDAAPNKKCEDEGGECIDADCSICCSKTYLGYTTSDTTSLRKECCIYSNGVCDDPNNCSVCCKKDFNGNKNGNDIEGNPEQMCEPTCVERGGKDVSGICCELDTSNNTTGNDIDGNPDATCCSSSNGNFVSMGSSGGVCCSTTNKWTTIDSTANAMCCADAGGFDINGTCCELDSSGSVTGKDINSTPNTTCCVGASGTLVGSICCSTSNVGETIDGTADAMCCSNAGGYCSDSGCTTCCSGTNIGYTMSGSSDAVCCNSGGGICPDSACTTCCSGTNIGYTMGGSSDAVCCTTHGGKCSDASCTICCDSSYTGKTIFGIEEELCKKTCEDQGGEEIDGICCSKTAKGKTVEGLASSVCCEKHSGVCGNSSCDICCDNRYTGYTIQGVEEEACKQPSDCPSPECEWINGACCNSEARIAASSATNNPYAAATLCGTHTLDDRCCRPWFPGDYYVRGEN